MARVDIEELKNIDNVDKLTDIFTHRLNYDYELSPISTRYWKEDLADYILDKDIKLLAKHEDFHIIYCRLENLLLGVERPIVNQLLKEHPYLLIIFADKFHKNLHFVNIKYDEEIKNRRLFRRIVIGPDERLHTAAQRINMLEVVDEKISPLELQKRHDEAFDVEEVTKEFYEKFAEVFHILDQDIAEESSQIGTAKQAQIILNRLIFLYFIQKKGWLNNNKRYLYDNFLKYLKKDPKGNSFYSDFLFKLFQALSSQDDLYKESLGEIPFLNGGLFEVSPFTITPKLQSRLIIKNSTFKKIFDELLERFNFTVREDTPLDVEVAIDPEMLGKIFENLVLKLEKGEDLRKRTGSYYTPRVIVHFMCRESLKEYLTSESEIEKSKIESLFSINPAEQLTEEELQKLKNLISLPQARLLKSIIKKAYTLDPAVGSGAFLVGMLHEMITIIKLLDVVEFGQEYIQRINYDYELKRQLIETSLYGVDIQEQAVRICELRLWLSLIVDYEKVKDEDVPPLPNLSYKIRCGDSLIEELFGHNVQLDQLVQTDKGKQLIDEITKDKGAYFLARDIREKNRIELSTLAKQCELIELLIKEKQKSLDFQPSFLEETAKERQKREEFEKTKKEYEGVLFLASNTKKKIEAMLRGKISIPAEDIHNLKEKLGISFIWKLDFAEVFKEKGGFDIVIQNPPYVNMVEMEKLPSIYPKDEYRKKFITAVGGFDLYILFHELSIRLLHKEGISCIICPNKYLAAEYAITLRKWLIDNTIIRSISDVSMAKPFDAAVYPVISIYKRKSEDKGKEKELHSLFLFRSVGKTRDEIKILAPEKLSCKILNLTDDLNWSLILREGVKIIEKIYQDTFPLRSVCKILGGATVTEAYEIKKAVFDTLEVKNDLKNYVPFIVSGNVGRFCVTWAFEKTQYIKRTYFRPLLKINAKQVSETRRKQILQQKIIMSGMSKRPKVFYDDIGRAAAKSTVILLESTCDLEFLCGLLNSNLYAFIYNALFGSLALSGGYLRFGPPQIQKLPVRIPDKDFQSQATELVMKIQEIYEHNTYPLPEQEKQKVYQFECQIDQMVYKLYGLTEGEIRLVEESVKTLEGG